MSEQTFAHYFDAHLEVIKTVQVMLAKALNDDPMIMDNQVREIEAYLGVMKSIEAWANSYLDVAEEAGLRTLPKRSTDNTDLDRSTALATIVVKERRFRNVVKGMVESIQTRISYSQSRLRYIERNNG